MASLRVGRRLNQMEALIIGAGVTGLAAAGGPRSPGGGRASREARSAAGEYVMGFHAADPRRASLPAIAEQDDSASAALGRALDGYDRLVVELARGVAVAKNAVVRSV